MPRSPADRNWLASLVDEILKEQGPIDGTPKAAELPPAEKPVDLAAAARVLVARSLRTRRPPLPPMGPEEVFRETVRQHIVLLLDLRLFSPAAPTLERARAELAGFLAGALGEEALSLAAANDPPSPAHDRDVERALSAAGKTLRARFFPPGDPRSGLPLSSGSVAVLRRHLARVTGGFARSGRLEPEALARHAEFAAGELSALAEALSGLLSTGSSPDRRERFVRSRQLVRLGLAGSALREARRRVARPRSPEELARALPEPVRGFVLEQLFLAQLRSALPQDGPARLVEAFARAARLDPQVVVQAQVEAAAQAGDPQAFFKGAGDLAAALDWHALAEDFGAAADQVLERISTVVSQNLGALVEEIRQTGELGTLLGKAAAGGRLSADEKRKVRAQLIDLAKAVPALAIFAAPGGSLLLPILVKLLPFNLLPSAWDRVGGERRPPPAPGTEPEGAPAADPAESPPRKARTGGNVPRSRR